MATRIQITIDCHDSALLTRFWITALHYEQTRPPDGSQSWVDYWRARGLPEDELAEIADGGYDKISDPDGVGPTIWFQPVPETKTAKNRVHLDLDVINGRSAPLPERTARVEAEAERLIAAGATRFRTLTLEGVDYYGVVMQDPEGNEFCIS